MSATSYLAIVVAAGVAFVLSTVWYSVTGRQLNELRGWDADTARVPGGTAGRIRDLGRRALAAGC